jgi:acrylyl-CoA reductase (NADPH)/3-hydroxypropionyl-CoA dehydratase/3-hydroxypropionyl-CoA synthetase
VTKHDDNWGVLQSQQDEDQARASAVSDPAGYHANIAARELHWFNASASQWLSRCEGAWRGWHSQSGGQSEADTDWAPWSTPLDDTAAPFYRWFADGLTNACFNLLDRHVLSGGGKQQALVFEGDRWDPSKNGGRGGPVFEQRLNYRELLIEVALRARVLDRLGLSCGDRIALNLPNILEQIYYILAAQRLGVIYTPVFGGFSAKTLSDRIHDAGAKVVITADGGYRNAEVVPYKSAYVDPALDNYVPRPAALKALSETLHARLPAEVATRLEAQVADAVAGEITLERADVMRELGLALERERDTAPEIIAELRTTVASELANVGHAVEHVVVVRYTGNDIVEHGRDSWSHQIISELEAKALADAGVADRTALDSLDDTALWQAVGAHIPAVPVEANWPLFIIYTSGSTGKPKGVVHTHGGWLSGITHTMRTVFNGNQDDCLYVIGDPGWITGQSYLIAAPLAFGMSTVVAEGSPLFPHAGRFASIIERNQVTLFKAGSTFLKAVMTDPASTQEMSRYDMSTLKVGTFCAEPVSPTVQKFAMENICSHYINSYWATEHGGIVFSCPWGDFKPLEADAKTWPLPWVQAEVRIVETVGDDGAVSQWREAQAGEKGELVITQPYPYLARTLWGDGDMLGQAHWQGDIERFGEVYFRRWAGELTYTQGDYARRGEEGAFTLHGRSDDVINVSGHRIGTEEIEGAILRDKTLRQDSPVGNVVVVGAPHDEKGETPIAFLVAAAGRKLSDEDLSRLQNLVRTEKGATAVPSDFLVVSAFPETRSGKYMRRTLRAILLDQPLGDLSTLRNPESVEEIQSAVAQWRDFGRLAEARQIIQTWRYLRVETHRIDDQHKVALLVINHPPVNALNERTLDELHTVVQQLEHQDDVDACGYYGCTGCIRCRRRRQGAAGSR